MVGNVLNLKSFDMNGSLLLISRLVMPLIKFSTAFDWGVSALKLLTVILGVWGLRPWSSERESSRCSLEVTYIKESMPCRYEILLRSDVKDPETRDLLEVPRKPHFSHG